MQSSYANNKTLFYGTSKSAISNTIHWATLLKWTVVLIRFVRNFSLHRYNINQITMSNEAQVKYLQRNRLLHVWPSYILLQVLQTVD